jgi:DNA (cytosine-5)-methyltransferase 1
MGGFRRNQERIRMGKKNIRFIDLFCGIGGFRYAAGQACESLGAESEFVLSSDINKFSCQAYGANFGEYPQGDVSKIPVEEIPDFDVLLGGFPCQPFSKAGLQRGFDDTRGTLFFEIAKILSEKKPDAFVLENVKGLINHDKGKTLETILTTLKDLGYFVHYKVLDALDFGLPQHRERIFIVGFKDDRPFEFPEGNVPMKPLSEVLETEVPEKYFISDYLKSRVYTRDTATVSEPCIWTKIEFEHDHAYRVKPYSSTLTTSGPSSTHLVNGERRLTPRERLRLQGFPEDFKIVCSDSQTQKQAGNSLPVPVAKAVIEKVVKELTK